MLKTQYDVVKEVLKDNFGCKLSMEEEGEWDIFWADTGITSAIISKMKPYQKVNHFHGMSCLARKNHLGRNLMRIRKALPVDYNFFPPTWLLPAEWADFKNQFNGKKKKTFILKPEALSQGIGIFLTNTFEQIDTEQHYVAQRYITKPYLIEGLKFDLRIYVLVYGCDPLRIFLYKEGLARLATDKYVPPVEGNIENLFMHLTNYAINKNSEKFIFNTDPEKTDIGHKRSLTYVWKYIDEHGGDSKSLKEKIKDCIVKTLAAVHPLLAHSYRSCQPHDNSNNKCFEILGFDILLDHKLKPWLLEVNHSPSFTTDTPFDHKIKNELLTDTLRIVRMDPAKRIKFYEKKSELQQAQFMGKDKAKPSDDKEMRTEKRKKKMEKRDKYELENCGGFTRIYPEIDGEKKYEKFFIAAQEVWDQFTGARKKLDLKKKKAEIEEKQKPKKPPLNVKAIYSKPLNRKPLYYLNPNKITRRVPQPEELAFQLPEEVMNNKEMLLAFLNDPLTDTVSTINIFKIENCPNNIIKYSKSSNYFTCNCKTTNCKFRSSRRHKY